MSFGFSVGDIVTLLNLAHRTHKGWKGACGTYAAFTSDLALLKALLKRLEAQVREGKTGFVKSGSDLSDWKAVFKKCRQVLSQLERVLEKYDKIGGSRSKNWDSIKRDWQRLCMGSHSFEDLRSELHKAMEGLSAYFSALSASSLSRLENNVLPQMMEKINDIAAQMRKGNSSVLSGLTAYSNDDADVWREFRRDLIQSGFLSADIQRHSMALRTYLYRLQCKGALTEGAEAPLDQSTASRIADFIDNSQESTMRAVRSDGGARPKSHSSTNKVNAVPSGLSINKTSGPIYKSASQLEAAALSMDSSVPLHGVARPSAEETSLNSATDVQQYLRPRHDSLDPDIQVTKAMLLTAECHSTKEDEQHTIQTMRNDENDDSVTNGPQEKQLEDSEVQSVPDQACDRPSESQRQEREALKSFSRACEIHRGIQQALERNTESCFERRLMSVERYTRRICKDKYSVLANGIQRIRLPEEDAHKNDEGQEQSLDGASTSHESSRPEQPTRSGFLSKAVSWFLAGEHVNGHKASEEGDQADEAGPTTREHGFKAGIDGKSAQPMFMLQEVALKRLPDQTVIRQRRERRRTNMKRCHESWEKTFLELLHYQKLASGAEALLDGLMREPPVAAGHPSSARFKGFDAWNAQRSAAKDLAAERRSECRKLAVVLLGCAQEDKNDANLLLQQLLRSGDELDVRASRVGVERCNQDVEDLTDMLSAFRS